MTNFPGQRPLLQLVEKHLRAVTAAPIPVTVDYGLTTQYQTKHSKPVEGKLYRVLFGHPKAADGVMSAAQPAERFVEPTFTVDGVTFRAHWQKVVVLETNTAGEFDGWCASVVKAFTDRNRDALAAWDEKHKEVM